MSTSADNVERLPVPGTAPADPERALRETVDLVADLARALVTQARHARRTVDEAGAPGAMAEVLDTLIAQATAAQGQSERLARSLTDVDAIDARGPDVPEVPGPVVLPPPPGADSAEASEMDPGVRECVEALAISLRLDGTSAPEVEAYLRREFGIGDAHEIVREAFSAGQPQTE